jgi:hypothetical protein
MANSFAIPGGRTVPSLIARWLKPQKHCVRWQVDPHPTGRMKVTLLARLTQNNDHSWTFTYLPASSEKEGFESRRRTHG